MSTKSFNILRILSLLTFAGKSPFALTLHQYCESILSWWCLRLLAAEVVGQLVAVEHTCTDNNSATFACCFLKAFVNSLLASESCSIWACIAFEYSSHIRLGLILSSSISLHALVLHSTF